MGNFTYQEYDERIADLRAMGAANWQQPPLPISPCIRVKATGEVHEWSQFFAERPDLCENCDEHGNTDPAAWQGRAPAGVGADMKQPDIYTDYKREQQQAKEEAWKEVAQPQGQPPIPAPAGLYFFPEQFEVGSVPGEVPPVHMATQVLGVPPAFAQTYTDPVATKAAMPLSAVGGQNVTVGDAVQQFFARQNHL